MLHGMKVRLRLEDGKESVQPATMEGDRRLAFDAYCPDLANERLLCGDEVVALTPKAFAVLRRLIAVASRVRPWWRTQSKSSRPVYVDRATDLIPESAPPWRARVSRQSEPPPPVYRPVDEGPVTWQRTYPRLVAAISFRL